MDIERLKLSIFFTWAWKKKPIFCQCGCGKRLPKEQCNSCIDHLVEKSTNPELKYSILNIGFFTIDCHTSKTNGFPNKKQKEMIQQVMENYDSIKKDSSIFETKLNKLINGKI